MSLLISVKNYNSLVEETMLPSTITLQALSHAHITSLSKLFTFFLALPPPDPSFFFCVFWGCLAEALVSFLGGWNYKNIVDNKLRHEVSYSNAPENSL